MQSTSSTLTKSMTTATTTTASSTSTALGLPPVEPLPASVLSALPPHRLSLVVPLYNEEDSVGPLVTRVHEALAGYPQPWELLLVDDGSSDATAERIDAARRHYGDHVRAVNLVRNFKQTAAMQAGMDRARGDVIVTLDGDLQNDPADIPRMVARLFHENLDLVAGWRKNRQDPTLLRKIPSWIANRLIARITGVRLHDYGCSLKIFRTSRLRKIRLYGDMHRFIPAWMATVTTPRRIAEEVVSHHPRRAGVSKYGISRTFVVVLDLLAVYFFLRFRTKPGHFFGLIGMALGGIGLLILSYLFGVKLLFNESIGTRPLLFAGFFMCIAGLQMMSTGVLAELLTRVYHESDSNPSYVAEDVPPLDGDAGWLGPTSTSH
jgi:glycosyltransferase involved in cell wall biosynthesis